MRREAGKDRSVVTRGTSEPPAFGPLLRTLRLAANLSQEALAERAHISKESVSTLERGTRRAPQAKTLELLIAALALDPSQRSELEAAAAASIVQRIRRRRSVAESASPSPTIPVIATSYVGRESEDEALAKLQRPGTCVTIWGSGGIGKTRLVLEFLRTHATAYAGGIWFIELAQLTEGNDIDRTIAAALGVQERRGVALLDTIVARLAGSQALLVLDNAEHVIDACARSVRHLLRDLPLLGIVCTSREPLRVDGERVFVLEPLPIPHADDPDIANAPAVRLFTDRAQSAGVTIDVAADTHAVAAICERLDAIPLALELAAARAPIMSPAQIAHGLDERFRLLTVAPRSSDPRHQTLAATLEWSAALLTDAERVVLRRLSAWPNVMTMDDAIAVSGFGEIDRWTTIDAVGRLVERSLVLAALAPGGDTRFRLLQTTHAYALACAEAAGEIAAGARRQATRIGETVDAACQAWRAGDDAPFRSIDLAALRAALRWTIVAENDVRLGAAVAGDSAMFWQFVGMEVEGLRWIDAAIATQSGEPPELASALIGRARLARRLRFHREAFAAAEHAARIAVQNGNALQRAVATLIMGDPAAVMGRPEEGRAHIEDAARQFEALGDARGRLASLWELAFLAFRTERYADARDQFSLLLETHRERGQFFVATQAAINLADAEFSLGHTDKAIARGSEALDMARSCEAYLMVVATLQNMAGYLLDDGNVAEALRYARESLEIAVARGLTVYVGFGMGHVADAFSRTGNMSEAALLAGYVDQVLAAAGGDGQATEIRGYRRMMQQFEDSPNRIELETLRRDGATLDDDEALEIAFA